MALNKVYVETQERNRDRELSLIETPTTAPTEIQPGVPVTFGDGPAVSLTASGNAIKVENDPTMLPGGVTSLSYRNGGVGNSEDPPSASFAFDGTFEFEVDGATPTTESGVEVFITNTGDLTLTAGSNVHYGWTDYPVSYFKRTGIAPVRIGA